MCQQRVTFQSWLKWDQTMSNAILTGITHTTLKTIVVINCTLVYLTLPCLMFGLWCLGNLNSSENWLCVYSCTAVQIKWFIHLKWMEYKVVERVGNTSDLIFLWRFRNLTRDKNIYPSTHSTLYHLKCNSWYSIKFFFDIFVRSELNLHWWHEHHSLTFDMINSAINNGPNLQTIFLVSTLFLMQNCKSYRPIEIELNQTYP